MHWYYSASNFYKYLINTVVQNLLNFHPCHVINCFKHECVLLECCRLPVVGNAWDLLMEYLDAHAAPDDGLYAGYICD